jgi:excisionase family DNA binding protein
MNFLTVEDVAERLKRSTGTVYNWIHRGECVGPKFKKIGNKPMISDVDLNEYYNNLKNIGGEK